MERKKNFVINVLYYGLIIMIAIVVCKYLVPLVVPFIIAFIIVALVRKLINKFDIKHNKGISILALILFYAVFVGIIVLLLGAGYLLFRNVWDSIPDIYYNIIEPEFDGLLDNLVSFNNYLPTELANSIDVVLNQLNDSIKDIVSTISSMAIGSITNFVAKIPRFVISCVVCIIASFFLMADYDNIIAYISGNIKGKAKFYYDEAISFIRNVLLVVLKAYFKIMTITFIELSIGLTLFNVRGSIGIAFCIAIFDILPIFGVGGILIPWTIISLLQANYLLAFELLALYAIISVVRTIIEPKIVGGELGLHPLATLVAMLVGLRLFGFLGMFGLPILLSFLLYIKKKTDLDNSHNFT